MLEKESFLTYVDTNVIYPQIQKNPSSIYSFLLMAGYLKAEETRYLMDEYEFEDDQENEFNEPS